MILYGINLVSLVEEIRDADPTLLSPFYADDAAFDGLARQSGGGLCLLLDRGPDQGYFPMTAKLLFISDNSENLTYVGETQYMGAYWGPREEL